MIDYETVRANNLAREAERKDREAVEGIRLGPHLSADEAEALHAYRQETARLDEEERHDREVFDFHRLITDKIDHLNKPGHENPRTAEELDRIRTEVCVFGRWPADSFALKGDPTLTLPFQKLRSRLAPKAEDHPHTVRISNPMFLWKD